ncbi:MAG: zinc ribbon domain-containing protein [Pseudomonadota bacterium]
MNCYACGAELDPRDKFCSKCGALTARGQGFGELTGRYVAEFAHGLGKLIGAAISYTTNPENRTKVSIGASLTFVLLISLTSNPISRGVGGLFNPSSDAPSFNDDGTPNFAAYEDVFLAESGSYAVTGQANVRDFPTSQETRIIGALAEGEIVMAREVQSFDPTSQWLKLNTGGYVWGGNLVSSEQLAPQGQPRFPAPLIGRWSDHAECTGSGQDREIVVSASSITIGRTRYDLIKIRGAGNEIPGYELAQRPGDTSATGSIIVQEDARYPAIWISYNNQPTGKAYRYYRSDYLCSDVRAIARLGTGM